MDYYLDLVQSVKKKYRLCKEAFLPQAVFSDESENFRKPAEPSAEDFVEISILTGRNNASAVCLCVDDKRLLMERVENGRVFDRYRVVLPPTEEAANYFFQIIYNETSYYYTRNGVSQEFPMDGYFRLLRNFQTPAWARGAVMYQIFVDRFCNGDPSNDVKTGEYNYLENQVQGVKDWYAQPEDGDFCHFYGGDLQGILQKMDYLQNLGVEVLYLNPIFVSPSSHKYDIQDYDHVDPHFGVIVEDYEKVVEPGEKNSQAKAYITRTTSEQNLMESDALFIRLVEEAHKRGMRVILDGVFNHCGAFHKWLDREEIYKYQKKGAYYCKQSPYHDYFYWKEDGSYEGWWDYPNHPKLNMENCSALYWEIMRIGQKWVSPPYNADGWRLDVASEINDGFWRAFRQAVKDEKAECILIGEVWETAQHWLNGDIFDSTMNYDFRKHCRRFFAEQSIDAAEFDARVTNMRMRYKLPVLYAQLNLLDSHDVSRFYSLCEKDPARMQLAVLFQMTFTGIPSVFYGDERGIYGLQEAEYRHEMTWSQEPPALAEFYKKAMHLRTEHPALCRGSYHTIKAEKKNGLYGYERTDEKEKITVFLNNQSAAADIPPMNGKILWQQGYEEKNNILAPMGFAVFTQEV